jgi:hypothetical protein
MTRETMTTETDPQEDAQRIWEQLDKEDSGQPAAEIVEPPAEGKAAEVTAEEAATPTQTQEPQTETAVDDDPKVLREKLAGMEAMFQQMQGRLRNAEGHIGGLSSQLKTQMEAAKAVKNSGGDAPTATEIREAQGDPESLKKLATEYPEFAKALSPAIDAVVSERLASLEARLKPAQAQQGPDVMQELNKLRAELTVETRHPGWQQEVVKPEFTGWLRQSPREVQMLAESPVPADAVRVMDLWKESRKPQVTNQTKGISAAAALPAGRQSGARQKTVAEMTPQEYWAYQDQLDKQKG